MENGPLCIFKKTESSSFQCDDPELFVLWLEENAAYTVSRQTSQPYVLAVVRPAGQPYGGRMYVHKSGVIRASILANTIIEPLLEAQDRNAILKQRAAAIHNVWRK